MRSLSSSATGLPSPNVSAERRDAQAPPLSPLFGYHRRHVRCDEFPHATDHLMYFWRLVLASARCKLATKTIVLRSKGIWNATNSRGRRWRRKEVVVAAVAERTTAAGAATAVERAAEEEELATARGSVTAR